jgi:hypothetical protein
LATPFVGSGQFIETTLALFHAVPALVDVERKWRSANEGDEDQGGKNKHSGAFRNPRSDLTNQQYLHEEKLIMKQFAKRLQAL